MARVRRGREGTRGEWGGAGISSEGAALRRPSNTLRWMKPMPLIHAFMDSLFGTPLSQIFAKIRALPNRLRVLWLLWAWWALTRMKRAVQSDPHLQLPQMNFKQLQPWNNVPTQGIKSMLWFLMQTYNGLKRFYLRIDSKNSFKHQRLVIIVTIDDETLKISELVNV